MSEVFFTAEEEELMEDALNTCEEGWGQRATYSSHDWQRNGVKLEKELPEAVQKLETEVTTISAVMHKNDLSCCKI